MKVKGIIHTNLTKFYNKFLKFYWNIILGALHWCEELLLASQYQHLLPSVRMYQHLLPSVRMYQHLLPSVRMYQHLLPSVRMYQRISHRTDFHEIWHWRLLWKSAEEVQIWLNMAKISGTLHEHLRTRTVSGDIKSPWNTLLEYNTIRLLGESRRYQYYANAPSSYFIHSLFCLNLLLYITAYPVSRPCL